MDLTDSEIRMKRNYMEHHPKALKLFFDVVQASCDDFKALDNWYVTAHALGLKMFRHLSTTQLLCRPHLDPLTGDLVVDHSSVAAVSRAAHETFIVFAHIFGPTDPDLRRFRYALWSRAGLRDRVGYSIARTGSQKEQREAEKQSILELTSEINASPLYKTEYSDDQRKQIEKGNWSGVHKTSILAQQAGLHPDYFQKIYKHASGHVHSNYISSLQVNQARDTETQTNLAMPALGVGLVLTTYFLTIFSRMSPTAARMLESDPDAISLFAVWHIQEDEWQKLYGG